MSSGVSARLKLHKKPELTKSSSQGLLNRLQQEGSMRTIENAMKRVEYVYSLLSSKNIDPMIPFKDDIYELLQTLKAYGSYLDLLYPEQLNRSFIVFRNSSQDNERLDYLSRLYLLELIELRANSWKSNDIMSQYYKKKASQHVQLEALETSSSLTDSMISTASSNTPILSPGELIKPSGKFVKPTRIAGKNYCKDEVVIRNADSGKVMGIKGRRVHMIEELSETIISFQRVTPGAKERLVQITGANEESINHAKQLIEDTIKRNASPVREPNIVAGAPLTGSSSSINSSASDDSALPPSARASRTLLHSLSSNDASLGEYKYSVLVGNSMIKITGNNLDLVRTSKLVLDEYFSGEPIQDLGQFYSFDSLPQAVRESTPESPGLPNGKLNELPSGLKKPFPPTENVIKRNVQSPVLLNNRHYSIELLARLAMSPLCLVDPSKWDCISSQYPYLVRKVLTIFVLQAGIFYNDHFLQRATFFDAKQYLSNRSTEGYSTIVVTENETEDV